MIAEAIELLESIRDSGQSTICVGVSGGKDSLATFDLCHQVFGPGNVHGYFLYLTPGLRCEERYVRFVENKYNVPIHRLRHPDMARYMRESHLSDVRPEVESLIRRHFKWGDVEAIMRRRTGVEWFAYGHRVCDSLQRRAMIQRHAGIIEKRSVCYPLWDWSPRDVLSYLRSKGLPIPPTMGSRIDRTSGIAPHSVECLLWLKKNYPDDLERLLAVFPRAMDLLTRDEVRAKWGVTKETGLFV